MEGQEHSADAVREIALDALTADGFPYTVAQDALNALAAKGITLAGPDQRVVSRADLELGARGIGCMIQTAINRVDGDVDSTLQRDIDMLEAARNRLRAALGAGPNVEGEGKRKYVIKWWHGGVTEASGTSAVDAVRTAFDPSQVKHVRRKGSIARGKTLVQITWTDDTGDQVEVHLLPKEATDDC